MEIHRKSRDALLILAAMCVFQPVLAHADGGSAELSAAAYCKSLENVDFSKVSDAPTQLVEAKLIEADGVVPSYCLAKGFIASYVGIEMRLPIANWNGKFIEVVYPLRAQYRGSGDPNDAANFVAVGPVKAER